ncbi:Vacuolar protein sorting-associated protein 11, partial [Perkinsus olseni]
YDDRLTRDRSRVRFSVPVYLVQFFLSRHPVVEDEKASSDLAPAAETPGPDSLSTPIEASLSQLLLPTEACAGMLLRHLSKKSRSSKSNSSSLLPPLCLELCLGCGLHRKDEATRLRMTDTLFDRNLGAKAQTMAEACFQSAWLDGVIALIESSYTRPEDARAFARALFDTADPADLTPASYVEVCNAVTDGPAGKTANKKLDEVTRKLWPQALRKLRRRPVEAPRDRTEALQAMNEIVGTLSRCCSGSPTVTSEVLDALALDPAVEEDSGTMVEMGTLKPMIRALLKGTGERCSTSLDNLQQDKEELQRMRQEVESLRTTARVFNGGESGGSPKCAECGQRMDLPAVHFMCMHSFHQLCLSSGDPTNHAEDEYKCPVCQPEATYKEGMRKEREESTQDPEALSNLYKAIGASPEDFSIVADYLGRGLFHTTTTMSSEPAYIPMDARPEWKGVRPVPQDDGPKPLVQIQYTEEFTDIHNYFRAVIKAGEASRRAFDLTAEVIDLNAANYTAYWRRKCLEELADDELLQGELEFTREWATDSPKNYQVWFHRRWVVQRLFDKQLLSNPDQEFEFTAEALSEDAKNLNAWSHRMFAVRLFGRNTTVSGLEAELDLSAGLLRDDLRNNSAWNHRFVILQMLAGIEPESLAERREAELIFVMEALKLTPNNESPWNFVMGILFDYAPMDRREIAALVEQVRSFARKAVDESQSTDLPPNRFALEYLARAAWQHDGDRENALSYYTRLAESDQVGEMSKALAAGERGSPEMTATLAESPTEDDSPEDDEQPLEDTVEGQSGGEDSDSRDPKQHTFTFGNSETSAKMIQQATAQFKEPRQEDNQQQLPSQGLPVDQRQPYVEPLYPDNTPQVPVGYPPAQQYGYSAQGWAPGGHPIPYPTYGHYGVAPAFVEPSLPMMVPYSAPAPPPLPTSYVQPRCVERRASRSRSFDEHYYGGARVTSGVMTGPNGGRGASPLEMVMEDRTGSSVSAVTSEHYSEEQEVPAWASTEGASTRQECTLDTHTDELHTLSLELSAECQEQGQQLQRDKTFQNEIVHDINRVWQECVELVGHDRLMAEFDRQRHEADVTNET